MRVPALALALLLPPAAGADEARWAIELPWGADSASRADSPRGADAPATPAGPLFGQGLASWYGLAFQGRRTASGERFDMHAMTAAHPSLPFGTRVLVRNPRDGRWVVVRINDRGPHVPGRVIDLSHAAARALGMLGFGPKVVELTAPGPEHLEQPARRPR